MGNHSYCKCVSTHLESQLTVIPSFQACSLMLHFSFCFSSESVTLSLTFHRRILCAFHSLASLPQNVTLLKTNKELATKLAFVFIQGQRKQFHLVLQPGSPFYFFSPHFQSKLSVVVKSD